MDKANLERQAIVAWLRDDAQRCNCFAHNEGECGCGAWLTEPGERSFKTAYVEDMADAIERGAHLEGQEHD